MAANRIELAPRGLAGELCARQALCVELFLVKQFSAAPSRMGPPGDALLAELFLVKQFLGH